jgi:hypothetical protein
VAEPIPAMNTEPGTDQGTAGNHSEWTQVLYLLLKITGNQVHELHNREIQGSLSLVMICHTAEDIRVQFRPSGFGHQGKKMVMYEK